MIIRVLVSIEREKKAVFLFDRAHKEVLIKIVDLGSQLSTLSRYVGYKLFSFPERFFIISIGIGIGRVSAPIF